MNPGTEDRAKSGIEVVLVDWAGTLTVPMTDMLQLAVAHLGLTDEQMAGSLGWLTEYVTGNDSMVHRAERGQITDSELFIWLDEQMPGASRLFDLEGPSILTAPDRPEMIDLLWWLRDIDVTVMLATNNFAVAQDMLASRYLDPGLVHGIVNSALVGARKPEPEFWQAIVDSLMVGPSEMVLLDDSRTNLEAAAELGMQTIAVGADATSAIADLKSLLGH